jgi:hypothetical protein
MMIGTAPRAQAPADRETILTGQHEVEDHEIWPRAGEHAVDSSAVLGDLDGKAFAREKIRQQHADVAVVLDEENGLAGHVSNLEAEETQAMPNRRTVTNRYKSSSC